MSTTPQSLPQAHKIALGGGALLFVSSFLPWYHASASFGGQSFSASHNGWHSAAFIVWILALAVALMIGARMFGLSPLPAATAERVTVALVGATAVVGILHVLIRLVNGQLGWGIIVGIIALLGLAYAGYVLGAGGAGRAMFDDAKAKAAESRGGKV